MKLRIITQPIVEPITLAEAKAHCRIDFIEDDELISGLISAARNYVEERTRRTLPLTTWELALDEVKGDIEIPRPPLVSINSITFEDSSGVVVTIPTADYVVDDISEPAIVRHKKNWGKGWGFNNGAVINAIRVNFTAGYTLIPKTLKQAILMLIAHYYENREPTAEGRNSGQIPHAVDALISLSRVYRQV
ncbi:MAG: hypothetical protein COA82_11050 [Alkaliphilus sp.]|nr:phage head-tail connector protein [bacterium AH-315-G05]PHS30871.1 MAG: hypothetical protein COA82_11050 [Alkaliphilus sp.]